MVNNEIILNKNNTFIMLIGLPASGKSTYAESMGIEYNIIGTDRVIDKISHATGLTYNELFLYKDIYKIAERVLYNDLNTSILSESSIIWDQTNLTKKSRASKLKMIPGNYFKAAFDFEVPPDHQLRLSSRPGKNIPENILSNMMNGYEPPVISEGFDAIHKIRAF